MGMAQIRKTIFRYYAVHITLGQSNFQIYIFHLTKQIPVFKLDGRKNKMEFIRGFKQVADHFGITRMVYEDINRPADEDEAGSQARWDNTNQIALEIALLRYDKSP